MKNKDFFVNMEGKNIKKRAAAFNLGKVGR
jgi:hypothetical protein